MHATEKFVYIYAVLLVAFLVFAGFSTANSQTWDDCDGPQVGGTGPCVPGWSVDPGVPEGPAEMCLGASGCFPVRYSPFGLFVIAESILPNGYPTLGWAGPCFFEREVCPDIGNQAFTDLRQNALRIHRGLRFEGL